MNTRTALIVILVFQFVAWIFYYDLPARVTLHNETMARMRMQEEALKEETKNMRIERIAFQDERQMLEAERLALKKERERLEKARYEIDAPKGAFWDPIWPVWECRSYGGREYWGVLRNIPNSWDHMDACMNMPVTIEGVTIRRPDRCQYEGDAMRAFWMVDWGQVNCKPWLQDIDDRGCTNPGSGIRRIEATVMGAHGKGQQDWHVLCETMPLTWNHVTYDRPTHCDERENWRRVAMWDIPDDRC